MSRNDGLRHCQFCHTNYLGGWCPVCEEADLNNESRIDHPVTRRLDREEINTQARKAAEDAFKEPFKVPLAEVSNTGGMEKMHLHSRRESIKGVPPIIADLLRAQPEGLTSLDVLEHLKRQRVFPAHLPRLAATQHLNSMADHGWVEKHPRSNRLGGPLWKLTGRPVDYSPTGEVARKKTQAKKVRQLKAAIKGNGAARPTVKVTGFAQMSDAIEKAIDALHSAQLALADIDTRELKLTQREQAIEAAKKLLSGI